MVCGIFPFLLLIDMHAQNFPVKQFHIAVVRKTPCFECSVFLFYFCLTIRFAPRSNNHFLCHSDIHFPERYLLAESLAVLFFQYGNALGAYELIYFVTYRLAGIYQTCIVTVLHFVPNGLKLRGHLGSELQHKAAAILFIEKDSNPAVSVVKVLKVRDGSLLDVPPHAVCMG